MTKDDEKNLDEILKNSTLPWKEGKSGDFELEPDFYDFEKLKLPGAQEQTTNTCPYGERTGINLYICDQEKEGPCQYRFKMLGSKESYCGRMIER